MRSIVGSNNWWCIGRFFADRIHLHPRFGAAVAAFRQLARIAPADSGVRNAALAAHADALSLVVIRLDAEEGATLAPKPGADARIATVAGGSFTVDSERGQHTLRVIARIQALRQIRHTRQDYEGSLDIDVEASCAPAWHKWVATLSVSDAALVSVYRGGAVWTPTRRYRDARAETCPLCHVRVRPSARHLWATCAGLSAQRARIAAEHRLLPSWFQNQPRCTAKTAWVTCGAGPTFRKRAECAIASSKMGIAVCRAMAPYIGREPVAPLLPPPGPPPSASMPLSSPSPASMPMSSPAPASMPMSSSLPVSVPVSPH